MMRSLLFVCCSCSCFFVVVIDVVICCLTDVSLMSPSTAKEPNVALHRFKRATISWSLGRVGSALEDYDSVIRMNPEFDQAYSSRGTIHLKQGRFQAAEDDYKHILQKNPNDVNAQTKVCFLPLQAFSS